MIEEQSTTKELEVDFQQKDHIEWEMGIDEAGRGPVMGSMVYACTVWPISHKQQLSQLGFNDSKVLKEETRDRLFEVIKQLNNKILIYKVIDLTAKYLSNSSLGQKEVNLNIVSHDSAIKLIRMVLEEGFNLKCVYVDTVGPKEKYQEKLKNTFQHIKEGIQFVVSEKADSKYSVVSAASICAKVTRDQIIKNWIFEEKFRFDTNFGSGYPADPKTKQWLQENFQAIFGYPTLIRFSWGTTQNIFEKKNLKLQFNKEDQIADPFKKNNSRFYKIDYQNFEF